MHATFEVVLRSLAPKPGKRLNFYSGADLDRALSQSGVDVAPFKPLYRPLTAMARRRKRIVHDADLASPTATVSEPWGFVDDYMLAYWLLAVPVFFFQLRVSTNTASDEERKRLSKLRTAMEGYTELGHELLAFAKVTPEQRSAAMEKLAKTTQRVTEILVGVRIV